MQEQWQCRWSPTLGALEDTAENIWGTKHYERVDLPTVFFGMYGLPDFWCVWRHQGRKAVLWAGTDIIHLKNGYWLEDGGGIRLSSRPIAIWLNKYCENWCENEVERLALKELGIEAKVCPSFLGDVKKFEIAFTPGNKVYTSVSGDNFKQYGWDKIDDLAQKHPEIEFHLYGNTKPWQTDKVNVIVHGRQPKERMNAEIRNMQGALRLTEFDGFSEILAKSVLWGQWPISVIEYPHMLTLNQLGQVQFKTEANIVGREHYLKTLNQYPWVSRS